MIEDIYRIGIFIVFGLATGFMVGTNVLAFLVLRPPKRLGFLWWHVTAVSLAFLCVSFAGLSYVLDRIGQGQGISAKAWVLGFGMVLFAVAQVIIFNVERQRYADQRAVAQHPEHGDPTGSSLGRA